MMETSSNKRLKRALSSVDGKVWEQGGRAGNGEALPRSCEWPINLEDRDSVVKLVVGKLDGEGANGDWTKVFGILENVKEYFPYLTHLHVWGIKEVETVGVLPEKLEVLDLRNCDSLLEINDLPETLDTLDLGGCGKVGTVPTKALPKLRWLYLDGCLSLESYSIQTWTRDAPCLEELSLKELKGITQIDLCKQSQEMANENSSCHPQFSPGRLKKLVLEGCSSLTKLPDLCDYSYLHHLNLNGCKSLESLPQLPVGATADGSLDLGVRYLLTHDCARLDDFSGLDVRQVHRSDSPKENAAGGFRTMQRLRENPAELVMAKLLLLGSGRCGKTTVAKALQWIEMDGGARGENPDMNPGKHQDSTHGIQFCPWETEFALSPEKKGGKPVKKAGKAHIWDFGGQQIYHNTHRLFASQGSVFVIVTTDEASHRVRVTEEIRKANDGEGKDILNDNEYRELKYWLDYIRKALGLQDVNDLSSRLGKVSIQIVHTGSESTSEAKAYLLEQAGPYGHLLKSGEIPMLAVNFHKPSAENQPGWEDRIEEMMMRTRGALGVAADAYGVKVPGVYSAAAKFCEKELLKEAECREILNFSGWADEVQAIAPFLPDTPARERLKLEQARASANYLHQCGRLFWLKGKSGDGDIIINQQWGVDLIYRLLERSKVCRFRGDTGQLMTDGRFRELLKGRRFYNNLDEAKKEIFFAYVDQCDICVKVGDKWMATQRELLSDKKEVVEGELEKLWNQGHLASADMVNHTFALHGGEGTMIGNSDFREVQAFLARGLGRDLARRLLFDEDDAKEKNEEWPGGVDQDRNYFSTSEAGSYQCRFWNDGFMFFICGQPGGQLGGSEKTAERVAVLQVEWSPNLEPVSQKAGFEGGIFIQLLTSDEEGDSARLKNLLFGDGGPLSLFKDKVEESDSRPTSLEGASMGSRRGIGLPKWPSKHGPALAKLRFDVAISYKSAQNDFVKQLVEGLTKAGLTHCYQYSGDELNALKEREGGSRITDIYDYLKYARVLVVVASHDYFEKADLDKRRNLYCPVELAEAVLANEKYKLEEKEKFKVSEERRDPEKFFWLSAPTLGKDNDGNMIMKHGAPTATDIEKKVKELLKNYFENVSQRRAPKSLQSPNLTEIDKREYRAIEEATDDSLKKFLDDVGRDAKQIVRVENKDEWVSLLVNRIKSALEEL